MAILCEFILSLRRPPVWSTAGRPRPFNLFDKNSHVPDPEMEWTLSAILGNL